MSNSDGYFKPGSLTLPAWLSPQQRSEALAIMDEVEGSLDRILVEASESEQSPEETGQVFVDYLNAHPENLITYAQLHTNLPVKAARALYDGIAEDGNWMISFDLDFDEPNSNKVVSGPVN